MKIRPSNIVVSFFVLCVAWSHLSNAQTFKTLSSFDASTTGSPPQAPLTIGVDGDLYGVAEYGGTGGGGSVFKLTPSGALSAFYSFVCVQDPCTGANTPMGGLLVTADGSFYGTTEYGGQYTDGELYNLSPSGNLTALHSFCSTDTGTCADGSSPETTLIQGSDGYLYGTTYSGGAGGSGTIFQVTPSSVNTIYSFCQNSPTCLDGYSPSGLVADSSGTTFYGTTSAGGKGNDKGTVFKISSSGGFSKIYDFCSEPSCADGEYPSAQPLVFGKDGNLYGTTTGGGFNNSGTVFKISTSGAFATLYSFCNGANCADGSYPAGLILGADGNFYGSTIVGGAVGSSAPEGAGTIYKMTPAGVLTTLYKFCPSGAQICPDGANPGPLVQARNGTLYGTTGSGGINNQSGTGHGDGTAFSLSLHGPARTALGALVDHFGTGGADFTVFRPSTGYFYSLDQADVSTAQHFGTSGDIPVNGDYDGDGKTDLAVFRPSSGDWYILQSSNKLAVVKHFGASGDIPLAGDFDGDAKSDIAVFRPSTGDWYILQSSNNQVVTKNFGIATDIPVVGDFDGDGKTDLAVFRPSTGTWYIIASDTGETITHTFGEAGDIPVPGYYDADAMTDIAVYRPSNGTFFYVQSSNGQSVLKAFGSPGDIPVAQDYDGDGRTDVAVFRPSTSVWYYIQSSTGELVGRPWGTTGDIPLNEAGH